jgi:signal transduction histidine kinase
MSPPTEKPQGFRLPGGTSFFNGGKFSLSRFLQRLSIAQKFYALFGIVAVILVFELASFWFAMNLMSSIRAYVEGEGLWSKAQKESLNSLLQYTNSFEQSDYDDFLSQLSVPLGDKQARLELEKPHPDLAIASEGLLRGGNSPADIKGMIFLYRNFRHVSYLERAINLWAQGDLHIEKQLGLGDQIHAAIAANPAPNTTKLKLLIDQAIDNDQTLTPLENQFSETLGEASRGVGDILLYAIFALTAVLGVGTFSIALLISRLMTQVDAAKSEFVALASHQLRSPLNVINLSIERLKILGPPRSIEEKEIVEGIGREVSQMASLVEAILNLSRIEVGALVVEPKTIDIMDFIRKEAYSVRILARDKNIKIEEVYEPSVLMVSMDPTLLQIIFQNLLSNAIKYTPPGGTINLSVTKQPSFVLLRISDTGDGIPKSQQHNIFKKLFRAANARKRDPHGTGLGLYVVKSIITSTGGEIWFDSEEGLGTTFYVLFPLSGMKPTRNNA